MDKLSQGQIIGIDVCRDWLDVYCLSDGYRRRLPNGPEGHAVVAELAQARDAVVCFESTGGQEWQLWARLETEGIVARQVPPAQVKAFAQSRGRRAKTDRIDAELIARFYAFRPEAGRSLPRKSSVSSGPWSQSGRSWSSCANIFSPRTLRIGNSVRPRCSRTSTPN